MPLPYQHFHRNAEKFSSLNARKPALINLPVPLPSLPSLPIVQPIVQPILTHLIAGKVATPTSAPGSGSDGGGSSGGSGGGSSGGGDTGGSTGGNSGGGSTSGGGSSGDTGSNPGSGTGSGSPNSGTGSSDSGSGSSGQGNTGSGSPNSNSGSSNSNANPGSNSGSSTPGGPNAGSSQANSELGSPAQGSDGSSSSQGSKKESSDTGNGGTESNESTEVSHDGSTQSDASSRLANGTMTAPSMLSSDPVIGSPVVNVAVTAGTGLPSALYTVDAHGSTVRLFPSSTNGAISGSNGEPGGQSGPHGGLSSGAISGIVVGCISACIILVIFLLRRRFIAKRIERRRNWWFNRGAARFDNNNNQNEKLNVPADVGNARNSARSSFGTWGTSFEDSPTPAPFHSFDTLPPALPPLAEIRGGQPLFSVSPDSPTIPGNFAQVQAQSPVPLISPVDNSHGPHAVELRRTSASSLFSMGSLSSDGSHSPFLDPPITPTIPMSFPAPPQHISPPSSAGRAGEAGFSFINKHVALGEVGTILRPFAPLLGDELNVNVGDQVKVQKVFDDGWAAVETCAAHSPAESGLIPVDCLRRQEEEVPAFLAAQRSSSYLLPQRDLHTSLK